MKFSYAMLPDYPLADSIEMIKTADELGFHACYCGGRDLAQGPLGPVRRGRGRDEENPLRPQRHAIVLREPTLICQAIATLDELTGGRTEVRLLDRQLRAARAVRASTGRRPSRSRG